MVHLGQKVITVCLMDDMAVVNGTDVPHHGTEGDQADDRDVFTSVFEPIRGRWVCVNSQRAQVREDENGKHKKSSKADRPFRMQSFLKHDKKNSKYLRS